ncbi:MAG TPA: protein kinase, partial [Rhodocyclaceae bacterium]|nr:protein kinase [Rhodocyclaceae bacterium]
MKNIGKYKVVKELGKGATATVYLCDDPDTQQQVAVKLVRFGKDNAAMSRRLRKLFQTEGVTASRLDHPNIVRIYDAIVEDDYAYLAMEYVEGESLEKHCRIDKLLPMHRVVAIIFKCCLALDHAYRGFRRRFRQALGQGGIDRVACSRTIDCQDNRGVRPLDPQTHVDSPRMRPLLRELRGGVRSSLMTLSMRTSSSRCVMRPCSATNFSAYSMIAPATSTPLARSMPSRISFCASAASPH